MTTLPAAATVFNQLIAEIAAALAPTVRRAVCALPPPSLSRSACFSSPPPTTRLRASLLPSKRTT